MSCIQIVATAFPRTIIGIVGLAEIIVARLSILG